MPIGALLIHGFTATPECFASLMQLLKKAGFEVEAPLLPGHGTTPEDLLKTTWQEWYEAVLKAFDALKKKTTRVCVAGQSLGGLLGLHLAAERPVDRLVAMATPLFFTGILSRVVLPILARTGLYNVYRYQKKWMGAAINDPWGKKHFKIYDEMPVKSIWEIVKLQAIVRPELENLQQPTLLIHSLQDSTVPYENMAVLEQTIGSSQIQTITLEKSDHVLTMDFDRELVAREIVGFFGGRARPKGGKR